MSTICLRWSCALVCALSLLILSAVSAAAQPQPVAPADDMYHVLLPLVLRSELPTGITNGDFEDGPTGWEEFSELGYPLIYHRATPGFPPLDPHSGDWLAWLGGVNDEVSSIQQRFIVPGPATHLSYYIWIASGDECVPGHDSWALIVNAGNNITPDDVLDGDPLCGGTSTPGWIRREVDITRYAGQPVVLTFVVATNSDLPSSLFVDDVSLDTDPLQPLVATPRQPLLAVPSRAAAPTLGSPPPPGLEPMLSVVRAGPAP
jgi:hypothetical protein